MVEETMEPTCENPFNENNGIVAAIKSLLPDEEILEEPVFRFDIGEDSANHNWNLLVENNFDLDKLLNAGHRSVTSFGSEFKCTEKLRILFGGHYRWSKLEQLLTNGVDFPLTKLDDRTRRMDLDVAFRRGNHASACQKYNILEKTISKEIFKGWNIIPPVDTYGHLPGAVLNPMGVATHNGITSDG